MEDVQQEYPACAVVGYHSHKVVQRGYHRAGSYRGVDVDLLEKERRERADSARNDYRDYQRNADAARHRKGVQNILALENADVKPYRDERENADEHAVEQPDPHFF